MNKWQQHLRLQLDSLHASVLEHSVKTTDIKKDEGLPLCICAAPLSAGDITWSQIVHSSGQAAELQHVVTSNSLRSSVQNGTARHFYSIK